MDCREIYYALSNLQYRMCHFMRPTFLPAGKQGKTLSTETVAKVQNLNRRTLDQLSARVYFYYTRFYELTGQLAEIRP